MPHFSQRWDEIPMVISTDVFSEHRGQSILMADIKSGGGKLRGLDGIEKGDEQFECITPTENWSFYKQGVE
jgi:hypothetical protein